MTLNQEWQRRGLDEERNSEREAEPTWSDRYDMHKDPWISFEENEGDFMGWDEESWLSFEESNGDFMDMTDDEYREFINGIADGHADKLANERAERELYNEIATEYARQQQEEFDRMAVDGASEEEGAGSNGGALGSETGVYNDGRGSTAGQEGTAEVRGDVGQASAGIEPTGVARDARGLGERSGNILSEWSYGKDNWVEKLPDRTGKGTSTSQVDIMIDAARSGDQEAIAALSQYGIPVGKSGVFRFIGEDELNDLMANKHYSGRFGDGKVDVTSSSDATTAAHAEYRVTMNEEFDLYKEGSVRTRLKSDELGDGWIMDGYDIRDVAKIEKRQDDGSWQSVYDATATNWVRTEPTEAQKLSESVMEQGDELEEGDVDFEVGKSYDLADGGYMTIMELNGWEVTARFYNKDGKLLGTVAEPARVLMSSIEESVNAEPPTSGAVRDEANVATSLQWSNERAGNGEPFLIGENGSIDLVDIPQEVFDKMGINKAPFRLTPSMVAHVYERHKKELHLNSHEDAVKAILDVMTNFDRVRRGRENTYVFAIEGTRIGSARRAVTFVLEYDKGEWLGIKTVGYDRISNLKELPILWEKGEKNSSTTGVAPANVTSDQSSRGDQTDGIASNQSTGYSADKGSASVVEKQADLQNSSEHEGVKQVATEPTEGQKAAGNYKKKHVRVDGHNISIENERGSVRRGVDADGKAWETEMKHDYGYIRDTESVDGDHIDVFLSENPEQGDVFVIDQVKADGSFDEHKVMYGFASEQEAREAYLSNYEDGWQGLGNITHVSKEEFKKWIESSKRKTKPFREYIVVKEITPDQMALLDGRNSHQYPATRESSAGKGNTLPSKEQEVIERTEANNGIDPSGAGDRILSARLCSREGLLDVYWGASDESPTILVQHPSGFELAYEIKFDGEEWVVNIVPVVVEYSDGKLCVSVVPIEERHKLASKLQRRIKTKPQPAMQREIVSKYVPRELREYFESGEAYKDNKASQGVGARERVYKGCGIVYAKAGSPGTDSSMENVFDRYNAQMSMSAERRRAEAFMKSKKADSWDDVRNLFNEFYGELLLDSPGGLTVGDCFAIFECYRVAAERFGELFPKDILTGLNNSESELRGWLKRIESNRRRRKSFASDIAEMEDDASDYSDEELEEEIATYERARLKYLRLIYVAYSDRLRHAIGVGVGNCPILKSDSEGWLERIAYCNLELGVLYKERERRSRGAQFSMGNKKTPVTGLPNRANEKQTSGSVLPSISGNSSSNRAASKEAEAKILNRTKSTKRKIKEFSNQDYQVSLESLNETLSDLGKLLSMDAKGGSRYTVLRTDGGETVAIRLSDHAANGNNFAQDGADRSLSVVIERRVFDSNESSVEYTEAIIPMSAYESNGQAVVKAVVNGIEAVLADKPFELDESLGTVERRGGMLPSPQFHAAERGQDANEMAQNAVMECLRRCGIEVVEVTQAEAMAKAASAGVDVLATDAGVVYGWTENGRIFLSPEGLDAETPAHEYTHLWVSAMMSSSPKVWNGIVKLLKGATMWEDVVNDPLYANVRGDDNAVASEVLSRLSGQKAKEYFEREAEKVANEGGAFEQAQVSAMIDRVRRAVSRFWTWVAKNLFGIKKFKSIDEVTDRVLYDLARGTRLDMGDKEKSLAGIHNISIDKLRKAMKMGGLANPSVAVIDVERQSHDGYGEISLVMPSEKLNKGKEGSGGTYTGDAWTPMYPSVERSFAGRGGQMASEDIAKLPKEMQSAARDGMNRWMDGKSAVDMSYWFLHERGMAPELSYMHSTMPRELTDRVYELMRRNETGYPDGVYIEDAMPQEDYAELEQLYIDKNLNGNRDAYNYLMDEYRKTLEEKASNAGIFGENAKSKLEALDKVRNPLIDGWVRTVMNDHQREGRFDLPATEKAAQAIIDDSPELLKEFESWLEELTERYGIKEELFNGFTPSGNRRYLPHTLENVSKLMREQGKNGSIAWSNGVPNAMAPLSTTEKISAQQDRLVSDRRELTDFDEKWMEDYQTLREVCGNGDWIAGRARLDEALGKANPAQWLSREYGVKLTEEQGAMLEELQRSVREERPAMYFETKFERPVMFNEFASAVVPENTPADVIDFLRSQGLQIETYEANNKTSRQEAVQRATQSEGVMFRAENRNADGVQTQFGDGAEKSFAERQRKAVADRGTVTPGLADMEIEVVNVPRHDFGGTGKQAIEKARRWAIENLKGYHVAKEGTSGEFSYNIDAEAIGKYLSQSSTTLSENLGVHLAVLKQLPAIINSSIDAEVHANYRKGSRGTRSVDNGVESEEILVHRLYGAAVIDGKLYRIKTTLKEFNGDQPNQPYNYQVTKLELLISGSTTSNALSNSSSITGAKLLNGVEKSYEPGKKLLDESVKSSAQFSIDDSRGAMAGRVEELSERLGVRVRVVADEAAIEQLPTARHRCAKGWVDGDEVVIVLPNHDSVEDVEETFLHEVVGHYGLRRLIGKERFDAFLDDVYSHASWAVKAAIDRRVQAERKRWIEAKTQGGGRIFAVADEMAEQEARFRRVATEEYMAELAERIGEDGFERMSREEQTLWGKIKSGIEAMLDKLMRGLGMSRGVKMTDKELSYILFKSWWNLRREGNRRSIFDAAEDAAMRHKTGYEKTGGSKATTGKSAQNSKPGLNPSTLSDYEHFAKVIEKIQTAKSNLVKVADLYAKTSDPYGFVTNLKIALGMEDDIDEPSAYRRFELPTGEFVDIRVSNHNANAEYATANIPMISIVIKGKKSRKTFRAADGKVVDEFVYFSKGLRKAPIGTLSKIAESISEMLDTGAYTDKTGLAKENHSPESDEGLRFRTVADYVERDPVMARAMYEKRLQSSMYQFTEAMQDSMRGLMEFYRAVEAQSGNRDIKEVASFENAYVAENVMSSANRAQWEEYERRVFRPLLEVVVRMAKDKKSHEELIDYMMAKHGLERNAYMRQEASNNGEPTDRDFAGLCGLTGEQDWQAAEAKAAQMVAAYEQAHSADIAELWDAVNRATKTSLNKVYTSGLLSKDQYEKIRDMYQYYIPLRGFDEQTSSDVYAYLTGRDGAMTSPIRKAEGRKSKADDPLATIALIAQNSITQGNRNLMKQKFLNYVQNHPSDLASVNKVWLRHDDVNNEWTPVFADIDETMTPSEIEREILDFEQRMEALAKAEPDKYKRGRDAVNIPYRVVDGKGAEHRVIVKRNGESFVITINGNPRAAQAINGITNPDNDLTGAVGAIFNLTGYINRKLSQAYTSANPDFVVSNLWRDLVYSNVMVHVNESEEYARKFHWNHAKANPFYMMRLLRLYENDKLDMNNKMHRAFYEFIHRGGETGYTIHRDLEQEKKLVAKIMKDASRGKIHPRRVLKLIGTLLDRVNRGVENSARFAAFVTSRAMGRDVQRAVYDAKELTVNFNKKGGGSKMMGAKGQTAVGNVAAFSSGFGRALYCFWNAAIQGTTNFGKAFGKYPVKATAATTAMLMLGFFLAAMADDGDDDDKNGYYNMPKSTRRSNMMFRVGDYWLTFPLSVEYRAVYGLGELAYGVISGREEYSNIGLATEIAEQLSQVLPLDFMEGSGGWHAFVPSAIKPAVETASNTSWTGLPIYRETSFNEDAPEWTKAYSRTNPRLVELSKWSSDATGGNDYQPGEVNFNPGQLEYLLNGYFGGYVNTVNKFIKTGDMMAGEKEFDPSGVLLVNRFVKTGDERTADRKMNSDFFGYLEEYERTHYLLRKYEQEVERGNDGYNMWLDALQKSNDGLRHDAVEEEMKEYNKINRKLKDPDLDDEERTELEGEILELKRKIVGRVKISEAS